jgi:hypothetical protein
MTSNIHPNLQGLEVDISLLDKLPNNPRKGDPDAIAQSLENFGQVKPIVVRPSGDGRFTILAGNHTVEAAKLLGWDSIAAVCAEEMDDKTAVAFALVDNQVADLAEYDEAILAQVAGEVYEDFPDLMEFFGWDEFELASASITYSNVDDEPVTRGYVAPELVTRPGDNRSGAPSIAAVQVFDSDGESRLVAPVGTDVRSAVVAGVGGATSQNVNSKRAAVQYTLVFDDADQMGRWWDFVKFLRNSPVYPGETVAERIISFVEAHGEF